MAYQSLDFTDLPAAVNKYLNKNYPQFMRVLKYGDDVSQHITTVTSVDGYYTIPRATIGELIQGFQKAFVAKGKINFIPESIFVRRSMVDYPFLAQDHYDKWYSKLDRSTDTDRPLTPQTYPFAQYIVELLQEQMIDDETVKVAFKGNYKPIVADVPQQSKFASEGIYTCVKRLIKEGKIIPIFVGTFDASNILDFTTDFFNKINELYQMKAMKCFTSIANRRLYNKEFKDTYADSNAERTGLDLRNNRPIFLEDSNTEIVGFGGMAGLKTLIVTPQTNVVKVVSQFMTPFQAKMPFKEILFMGDYGRAYGIGMPEVCFVGGEIIEPPAAAPVASSVTATGMTITIDEVPGATGYEYDISTSSTFASFVTQNTDFGAITVNAVDVTAYDGSTVKEYRVSRAITGLTTATPYYVRVRAKITVDAGTPNAGTVYKSQNSAVLTQATA